MYAPDKECFSEVSLPRTYHLSYWLMIVNEEMHGRANDIMSVPVRYRDSHEI